MNQIPKGQPPKPAHTPPAPLGQVNQQKLKQKAEASEVAGRHKIDGQKDHKGAL